MPHLTNLYNAFPDSVLQIFGINFQDSPKRVEREVNKLDLPYPNLIGRGSSIARDFKIKTLPYLYIIDKEGIVNYAEIFVMYDFMEEIVSATSSLIFWLSWAYTPNEEWMFLIRASVLTSGS